MSRRLNYNAASPAGMNALGTVYGYARQSGLPPRLVDLVFLRVWPSAFARDPDR